MDWESLGAGVVIAILFIFFHNVLNLSVNRYSSADNAKNYENRNKNALSMQPSIQVETDDKTKCNGADHGQPQLHHYGQMSGPLSIFFKIEYHRSALGALWKLSYFRYQSFFIRVKLRANRKKSKFKTSLIK